MIFSNPIMVTTMLGIASQSGEGIISGNIIRDLKDANPATGSGALASVIGIEYESGSNGTITQNSNLQYPKHGVDWCASLWN
jgi:hypothetical protein